MAKQLDIKTVVKILTTELNRQIADDYARQSINKLPEHYTVKLKELQNAFKEAYVYIWNDSLKGSKEEKTRWPDPFSKGTTKTGDIVSNVMRNGFNAAGREALDWLNRTIDSGRFSGTSRVEGSSSAPLEFLQTQHNRHFFAGMKTAGLKKLSEYIVQADGKEMSFYHRRKRVEGDDTGDGKSGPPSSEAEDLLFRRLLHREHTGTTTTGMAALSARIQYLDKVSPNFFGVMVGKADPKMTNLLGEIASSYEVRTKKSELAKIKLSSSQAAVHLKLGSFKFNLSGTRAKDLVRTSRVFTELAESALNAIGEDNKFIQELMALGDVQLVKTHITNAIGTNLAGTGGKYKQKRLVQNAKPGTEIPGHVAKPDGVAFSAGKSSKTKANKYQEDFDDDDDKIKLSRILQILRSKITETVIDNMGTPRLNYQTGRFARTITVEAIERNPVKDTLSVRYRYMIKPYRLYEKWDSQSDTRDPRKLIHESIREIMKKDVAGIMKNPAELKNFTLRREGYTTHIAREDWTPV
ncbi:MAG: hypothetical protein JRJ85_25150 [Deltaproteobacteria bacterium]|nr:hypothetical protein [Deltaproteobacteria bacterium]